MAEKPKNKTNTAQQQPNEAKANGQGNDKAPLFRLAGQFVADLSFECPKAPTMLDPQQKNNLEFTFGLDSKRIEGDMYEVALTLKGNNQSPDKKPVYLIELRYTGVFELKNIPQEQMRPLLAVEAPALIYPFARQKFMSAIMDSGFRPPMLDPINFHALYTQAQQQQQQAKDAPKQ